MGRGIHCRQQYTPFQGVHLEHRALRFHFSYQVPRKKLLPAQVETMNSLIAKGWWGKLIGEPAYPYNNPKYSQTFLITWIHLALWSLQVPIVKSFNFLKNRYVITHSHSDWFTKTRKNWDSSFIFSLPLSLTLFPPTPPHLRHNPFLRQKWKQP